METDERIPFRSAQIGYIFVGVFLVLFLGGVILAALVNPVPENPGTHSYSYSAIGHHALLEIAREAGFKIVTMHRFFHLQGGGMQTILFLEPNPDYWQNYTMQSLQSNMESMLDKGSTIVIACPKWRYSGKSRQNSLWIEKKILLSEKEAQSIFYDLNLPLTISRSESNINSVEEHWENGQIRKIYTETLQVLNGRNLSPLITTTTGEILVGSLLCRRGTIVVISDPDLFQNFSIGKEDNGVIMLSLLAFLTQGNKTLWVDEISHNLGRPPSILGELLAYPTLCITLQILLCLAFLAWMVGVRFQTPFPIPRQNRSLQEQTRAFANTISSGNKHHYFFQKYIHSVIMELIEFYPSTASLSFSQKVEYLDQIGKSRNLPHSIKKMYIQSQKMSGIRTIIHLVKGIHQWKQQMISYKQSVI